MSAAANPKQDTAMSSQSFSPLNSFAITFFDRISALGQITGLLGCSQRAPVPSCPRGWLWVSSYWGVLRTDGHLYNLQIRPVHRNRYEKLLPRKACAWPHLSHCFPWGFTSKIACSYPSLSDWETKRDLETVFLASVRFIQRFPVWMWEMHSASLSPSPHGDYWDNSSHDCMPRVNSIHAHKMFWKYKVGRLITFNQ